MSRREALLSAGLVLLVALAVRIWAASQVVFPRPEDTAYYVGVARNLVEGRGLVSDAIWSFQTPPLEFPRPAFEVWLPLPSFLAAIPMALFGTTFAAAQVSSIVVGSVVCVLAWRLAADVAAARGLSTGRARTLALGAGLTSAVYLPLVLASAEPDSTMPFAALVLAACLVIARVTRPVTIPSPAPPTADLLVQARAEAGRRSRYLLLGILLGLAALTRNEAIWLALTFAIVTWTATRPLAAAGRRRLELWAIQLVGVGVIALIVFAPWAVRDWFAFGSPLPGQALTNALSLDGRDIFAWQTPPTLARYLGAGLPALLGMRWGGLVHNTLSVLTLLGVPLSIVGLLWLPRAARQEPLRPLAWFSIITFLVASLVFPVSTTWGTFLHAAGAIHVLLVISALLALDSLIAWVGVRRSWTRPVAWLGPAFAIAGCLLFSGALLTSDGNASRETAARYQRLATALADPAFAAPLATEPGPIITDFPIWLAESTRHHTLALPNEPIASVLDLASRFDPPARLLVVDARNSGVWPATIIAGDPGADCFVPLDLPVEGVLAFRIRC